jgi:hypothetical protein
VARPGDEHARRACAGYPCYRCDERVLTTDGHATLCADACPSGPL